MGNKTDASSGSPLAPPPTPPASSGMVALDTERAEPAHSAAGQDTSSTQGPSKRVDVVSAPIEVDPGESIASITLGMKLNEVKALGMQLEREGVDRGDRIGWVLGPLLVLVDGNDRVVLVSVELGKSRGIIVSGRSVPPTASLDRIASLAPGCTKGHGSGGDVVDCRGASGKLVHFWGSHGSKDITLTLDQALLR